MKSKKIASGELKLEGNDGLNIFFIGVGSAFSKKHFQNNILILKNNDHLMIDCGTKTPQALFELNIPLGDINNFLITHSHADHIGGLEEVMLINRYVLRKKPNIYITASYQHLLWDHSLRGGCSFNEESAGNFLSFNDFWTVHRPEWLDKFSRETWEINVGEINIKMFRTQHIPDSSKDWTDSFWSTGIIIDDKVLFTSDTMFDKELLDLYLNSFPIETIFHDTQFYPGGVHANFDQLCTLPKEYKERMVLMHYGDNWENYINKAKNEGFDGFAKQWHMYNFK